MHPVLIDLGGFELRSYGVGIALAFLVAIVLGARSAERQAISVTRLLDLAFWVVISALIGSRLIFVIANAGHYVGLCLHGAAAGDAPRAGGQLLFDCTRWLHFWEGGLVFYGGLIGATLTSVVYLRRHKIDFFRVADLAIPLIALAHAIGRLGCFAAGCCFGHATASGLGVRFGAGSVALDDLKQRGQLPLFARLTPPLHPTQLYEALLELGLFFLLVTRNARRRYFGQTFTLYLLLYPPARAVIELFRADPARRFLFVASAPALARLLGLPEDAALFCSTSQAISAGVIVTGLLLRRHLRRRAARPAEAGEQ